MTKIEKCHADIVAPPFYHIKPLADHRGLGSGLAAKLGPDAPESRTWRERVPQLFFRGSTTGGGVKAGTPYQRFHRQRLVALAANDSRMDIGFTTFLQVGRAT